MVFILKFNMNHRNTVYEQGDIKSPVPVVLSVLLSISTSNATDANQLSTFGTIMIILYAAYYLFFEIYTAIKLGDAFKKGAGFKVGLVLLPNLFLLILAFGASKYAKAGKKAEK